MRARGLTIAQRLTLLIGGLVIALILLSGWRLYGAAADTRTEETRLRLQSAATQVSSMLGTAARALIAQLEQTAANAAIRDYALHPSPRGIPAVKAAIAVVAPAGQSANIATMILDAQRTPVFTSGDWPDAAGRSALLDVATRDAPTTGRAAIGPLRVDKDGSAYGTVAAIVADSQVVGFLVQWRRVVSSSQVLEQLGGIAGPQARFLLGNSGDSTWTDVHSAVRGPALTAKDSALLVTRISDSVAWLGTARPVPYTPWMVMVGEPGNSIRMSAVSVLVRTAEGGIVLLIIGLAGAWTISSRITAPMAELARAADLVGETESFPDIAVGRKDEVGRVAVAFRRMTARLARRRAELNERIAEGIAAARRYQLLFDANPEPMWVFDTMTLRFLAVNDAAVRQYGWTREEFLSMDLSNIRPASLVAPLRARIAAVGGTENVAERSRHRRKDGTEFDVEINSTPLVLDGVSARMVRATDLTERERAEKALRDAEGYLRQAVSASAAIIYKLGFVDGRAVHLYTSENLSRLFGYDVSEVGEPRWWASNIHPDDRARLMPEERNGIFGNGARMYRFRHKSGAWRWVRDEQRVEKDADGQVTGIVGAWVDITDQRTLEDQLLQAQKMEAVGRLAGGVAHDFNNILTILLAETELLWAESTGRSAEEIESLGALRRGAERAAMLTRQLLTFSRRQFVEPRVFELDRAVAEVESMLQRTIGEDIALTVRPAAPRVRVQADVGQLGQVLLNVAINARDAMPDGGRLTIETRAGLNGEASPVVDIVVTDTGTGMPPEVRAHLFEPFFTTKAPGKGTGLGLATSYSIVKQAGGDIFVASEVGAGTTFIVRLPVAADTTPESVIVADSPAPRGSETVLLVEDDEQVRHVAARDLRSLGYDVVEASDGRAALASLAARRHEIRLLVTDVVMPGLDGRTVAEAALAFAPRLRVLFVSGYSDDEILRRQVEMGEVGLLHKPFTRDQLARRVRDELDRAPT